MTPSSAERKPRPSDERNSMFAFESRRGEAVPSVGLGVAPAEAVATVARLLLLRRGHHHRLVNNETWALLEHQCVRSALRLALVSKSSASQLLEAARRPATASIGRLLVAILGEGPCLAIVRARRLWRRGDCALGVGQCVGRLPLLKEDVRAVAQQPFVVIGHAEGVGQRVLAPPPSPLVGGLVRPVPRARHLLARGLLERVQSLLGLLAQQLPARVLHRIERGARALRAAAQRSQARLAPQPVARGLLRSRNGEA